MTPAGPRCTPCPFIYARCRNGTDGTCCELSGQGPLGAGTRGGHVGVLVTRSVLTGLTLCASVSVGCTSGASSTPGVRLGQRGPLSPTVSGSGPVLGPRVGHPDAGSLGSPAALSPRSPTWLLGLRAERPWVTRVPQANAGQVTGEGRWPCPTGSGGDSDGLASAGAVAVAPADESHTGMQAQRVRFPQFS